MDLFQSKIVSEGFSTEEQKIKQDVIFIGKNIREIRRLRHIGQTEPVRQMQLLGVDVTRETPVKIERGIQHIYASRLRAIREILKTSCDDEPFHIYRRKNCENATLFDINSKKFNKSEKLKGGLLCFAAKLQLTLKFAHRPLTANFAHFTFS